MAKDDNGLGLLGKLASYYAIGKAAQGAAGAMGIGTPLRENPNTEKYKKNCRPCPGQAWLDNERMMNRK